MDFSFFLGFLMIIKVSGDCYMQNPRGSNNRLNEQSANRNNGNRLFDSQNNNRGGYNVGDISETAFTPGNTGQGASSTVFGATVNALDQGQYSMMFFEKSDLVVEWTNQHGCGGNEATDPNKLNCNLVFQYGWQTDNTLLAGSPQYWLDLKSGRNTNTPGTANTINDFATQHAANDAAGTGRHEHEAWYYMCEKIYRNKGLFLADQNVKGESAQYTRQNPNGNRRGLECPEERDYYPYWQPTPWMDLAVLTDNVEDCTARFNIQGESQNVKDKWACIWTDPNTPNEECYKYYDNMTKCAEMGCTAKSFNHNVNAPRCEQAPWTRANSLGNGRSGMPTTLNITFPALSNTLPDGVGKYTNIAVVNGQKITKGIIRIRYNISTDDYDVANTNSSQNYDLNANPEPIVSPVTQNPTVDIGLNNLQGLRLAINTNQFGRTFQDRTHVFYLMENNVDATAQIQNVVVRGKRGNIVQTFPAVEYDYVPKRKTFSAATPTIVHMQWTGSNTHNNGNPAGDGQAGDAGEGTTGTDRHNIMPLSGPGENYPPPFAKSDYSAGNIFEHWACMAPKSTVTGTGTTSAKDWTDLGYEPVSRGACALRMSSSGYYNDFGEASTKPTLSVLLNNAPASLVGGQILKPPTSVTDRQDYHFMCTRNNNFSNRSQKGVFRVEP